MNKTLFLAAGLLAGCTTLDTMPGPLAQPPLAITGIFQDVNSRITYQHYAKTDFREVKGRGEGNCSVIAYNTFLMARKAGYSPIIHTCLTPNLEGHQYTEVDGWALDNLRRAPISMAAVDCVDYRPPFTGEEKQ